MQKKFNVIVSNFGKNILPHCPYTTIAMVQNIAQVQRIQHEHKLKVELTLSLDLNI